MKSYIWYMDGTMKMFCLPHVFFVCLINLCHMCFCFVAIHVTLSQKLIQVSLIQTKVYVMETRVHQESNYVFSNLLKNAVAHR